MAAGSASVGPRLWLLTALRGGLLLIFGILTLAVPGLTTATVFALFGAFVALDALLCLVTGLRFVRAAWGWAIAEAAAGLAAGVLVLLYPAQTARLVVMIVAGWAAVSGVARLILSRRLHRSGQSNWSWVAVSGVATVFIGVFFLVNPSLGVALIGTGIGLLSVITGAVLIFGSYRLWRTRNDLDRRLRRTRQG